MINSQISPSGEYILARLPGLFFAFVQSFSPLNSFAQEENILKNTSQAYILLFLLLVSLTMLKAHAVFYI